MTLAPLKLRPVVQRYDWGKLGQESLVHRLLQSPEQSAPGAELWMGAHPSAPSLVEWGGAERRLDELIAELPAEILGASVVTQFGPALPFLMKVLSVRTALSIQAHPDRTLAAELHRRDPAHYPDKNHKPEMGIAVTQVELLYGFRTLSDIRREFAARPALAGVLTPDLSSRLLHSASVEGDQDLLKDLYSYFLHLESSALSDAIATIKIALEKSETPTPEDRWFLRLCEEHHSDVGLFSFFLLNHVIVEPGDGIFVGPNTPHAYLSGDLVECMASSDNVIRAGLTRKHCDVDALIGALHFKPAFPEIISRRPGASPGSFRYPAPAREFEVELLEAGTHGAELTLERKSLGLVFCLDGSAELSGDDISTVLLSAGESAIIPAANPRVVVRALTGRLFLVHVP